MKAKDLMIGDWVLIDFAPRNKYYEPGIITGLCSEEAEFEAKNQDGRLFYTDDEKKVLPVPLTAEILEKNGFETEKAYYGFVYVYDDDDRSLRIVFHPKESNYTRGAYSYIHIDCGCVTIEELPIYYVHELQHALQLCGVEKEINL